MLCQICEAEDAAFTVIPVGEGDPQILGPACFARSGLEFAKAALPAEEIAAVLGPMLVGPAAESPQPKAKTNPKTNPKAKPEAEKPAQAEPEKATGTE